jgi:hypothetical protein
MKLSNYEFPESDVFQVALEAETHQIQQNQPTKSALL